MSAPATACLDRPEPCSDAPAAMRTRDGAAAASGRCRNAQAAAQTVSTRVGDAAYGNHRPPHLTLQVGGGSAAHILTEEGSTARPLVVGSRGRDEIGGLLLGSVSAHCAEHAQCPVLIVHEPDQP